MVTGMACWDARNTLSTSFHRKKCDALKDERTTTWLGSLQFTSLDCLVNQVSLLNSTTLFTIIHSWERMRRNEMNSVDRETEQNVISVDQWIVAMEILVFLPYPPQRYSIRWKRSSKFALIREHCSEWKHINSKSINSIKNPGKSATTHTWKCFALPNKWKKLIRAREN